jgi:hypothetical protein
MQSIFLCWSQATSDPPRRCSTSAMRAHILRSNALTLSRLNYSLCRYLATRLGQRDKCVAMISTANCGHMTSLFRTLDGIDVGGHRLADEVRAFRLQPDMATLDSISFIGDGIGGTSLLFYGGVLRCVLICALGLYARYAIGVLLDNDGERLCNGLKAGNYM